MIKFGGIFPLIPILAAKIPGAAAAAAKAAALGAVGTVAGMALKKAVGGRYSKRGENISQITPLLANTSAITGSISKAPFNPVETLAALRTGKFTPGLIAPLLSQTLSQVAKN